jgi:hypothetical protein
MCRPQWNIGRLTIGSRTARRAHQSFSTRGNELVGLRAENLEGVMVDSSQRQTLSVRIGHALRRRIRGIQAREALRLGHPVSVSDVAKRLLAAGARGRDVEVADLLSDPTGVLLATRRKRAAGLPLTPAEWIVVAYYVQQGMESMRDGLGLVPRALVVGVLDAFSAVHALRARESAWDAQYLENLQDEGRCSGHPAGRTVITDMPCHVRETVAATRRQLVEGERTTMPPRAGRNLHTLLAHDDVTSAEEINQALSPHWSTLWSLAARGHYAITERPVRAATSWVASPDHKVPLVLRDGGVVVSFACDEELWISVTFPGRIAVVYPLPRYPVVREFRLMVEALADTASSWEGAWFRGYVGGAGDDGIWFRGLSNGITVGCHRQDWARLHGLFQQVWKTTDVELTWERLTSEYGEL